MRRQTCSVTAIYTEPDLSTAAVVRRLRRAVVAVAAHTVTVMRTELPAQRLHRRLGADPDPANKAAETGTTESHEDDQDDPNSLLPRWLPDGAAQQGWLARLRADPGRTGAIALAVIAALAVLITVFTLIGDRPAPVTSAKLPPVERVSATGARSSTTAAAGSEGPVVVSVVGLVRKPGLVTLAPGARIADALGAAGGALDGADTIGLNMARPVADGEQIVVGLAPPSGKPTVLGSSVSTGSPAGPAPSSAPATSGKPRNGPKPEALDLNSATVEQLDALPGVGPVTAAAIVAWRQANGRFTTVDQLAEVEGIGPARLDKLRALVRV